MVLFSEIDIDRNRIREVLRGYIEDKNRMKQADDLAASAKIEKDMWIVCKSRECRAILNFDYDVIDMMCEDVD